VWACKSGLRYSLDTWVETREIISAWPG
jgi:hypothetical protein